MSEGMTRGAWLTAEQAIDRVAEFFEDFDPSFGVETVEVSGRCLTYVNRGDPYATTLVTWDDFKPGERAHWFRSTWGDEVEKAEHDQPT